MCQVFYVCYLWLSRNYYPVLQTSGMKVGDVKFIWLLSWYLHLCSNKCHKHLFKTQCLVFPPQTVHFTGFPTSVNGKSIFPVPLVQNRGALFDFSLRPEIWFINRSYWLYIHNIYRITLIVTIPTTTTWVQTTIISCLDYCVRLLSNLATFNSCPSAVDYPRRI